MKHLTAARPISAALAILMAVTALTTGISPAEAAAVPQQPAGRVVAPLSPHAAWHLSPVRRSGAESLSSILIATGDRVVRLPRARPSALLAVLQRPLLPEHRRKPVSAGTIRTAARPRVSGMFARRNLCERCQKRCQMMSASEHSEAIFPDEKRMKWCRARSA